MNEITIIFDYKASGGEIKGLDEFRDTLKKDYMVSIRPNRKPQAGGVWDVFVEFYINTDLSDFVIGAILWDLVKVGMRNYIFQPVIEAFEKLEAKNDTLDYTPVIRFTFDDVQICFYGLNRAFFSAVGDCFKILTKHYEAIRELSQFDLYTIHIPAYLDTETSDREVYKVDPYQEPSKNDLSKYWALSYSVDHQRDVLDVENLRLLDRDWQREGSFFKSR